MSGTADGPSHGSIRVPHRSIIHFFKSMRIEYLLEILNIIDNRIV